MNEDKQLFSMIRDSPIAVYSCDKEGRITFFNEAAAALWGRRPTLNVDLWCGSWEIFYPDGTSMPLEVCPMAMALQLGKSFDNEEIIIERPDGSRRTVMVYPRPFFDNEGQVLGANNTLVDITVQKENEAKQAMLASIVTSSEDAIISKDLSGRITSWNDKAGEMFGYSADEIIGKSIKLIIPEFLFEEENRILDRIRRGELVRHYETQRISKSGLLKNISLTISPIKNLKGEITGASKIARDVSELVLNRKRIKKYTKELESLNGYKNDFMSLASHELKTPLTTVKAYMQLLEKNYENGVKGLDFIKKAIAGIYRLEKLVNDLMDISKLKAGQLEYNMIPVKFNEIIRSSIESLKFFSSTHEIIVKDTADVTLMADPVRLEQVLNNFLSNAIKYSPDANRVEIHSRREGNILIVSVKDFGIGIPKESIDRLVERYCRAPNSISVSPGLGIGLYLSTQILLKHNGKLLIESQVNKGSVFQFLMPIHNS